MGKVSPSSWKGSPRCLRRRSPGFSNRTVSDRSSLWPFTYHQSQRKSHHPHTVLLYSSSLSRLPLRWLSQTVSVKKFIITFPKLSKTTNTKGRKDLSLWVGRVNNVLLHPSRISSLLLWVPYLNTRCLKKLLSVEMRGNSGKVRNRTVGGNVTTPKCRRTDGKTPKKKKTGWRTIGVQLIVKKTTIIWTVMEENGKIQIKTRPDYLVY